MAFIWAAYFETGIDVVDNQHRGLVDLINEAEPMLTNPAGTTPDLLDALSNKLIAYADLHFKTEEGLMRSHGLLDAYQNKHNSAHTDFVSQVLGMRAEIDTSAPGDTGLALMRFLTSWLTFHILDEDQRMAAQIKAIEAGESPEAAFAASTELTCDDRSRSALVAALLDLYAVIGERNRSLLKTNIKLSETSAQLEASNHMLELRVARRTEELSKTLEQMEHAQLQLLQSEKMAAVGQLAAGVAHEINNPIGFVSSNLSTLKSYLEDIFQLIDTYDSGRENLPANDKWRQAIESVRASADIGYLRKDIAELLDESAQGLDRVKKIVADLKGFSRIDESEWLHADLNACLESTLNVVANELKYKAKIVKAYGELPKVHCIASQINQVFVNLLTNAGHAIEKQGTITLSTGTLDDGVWIEIRDSGQGMSEKVLTRIFDAFYTTKPVGKGTGLGLSISWDIVVKKHGGKLTAASTLGEGSCFRIELPLDCLGASLAEDCQGANLAETA